MSNDITMKKGEKVKLSVPQNKAFFVFWGMGTLLAFLFLVFQFMLERNLYLFWIMICIISLFIICILFLFHPKMLITNKRIIFIGTWTCSCIDNSQLEKITLRGWVPFFNAKHFCFIEKNGKIIIFPFVDNYLVIKNKIETVLGKKVE